MALIRRRPVAVSKDAGRLPSGEEASFVETRFALLRTGLFLIVRA